MLATESNDVLQTYLNDIPAKWRPVLSEVYTLITLWQPDLSVKIWSSMGRRIIGFGEVSYRYSSGRSGQWFVIGLGAYKNYCSLYVWGTIDNQYLLEVYQAQLGRVKIGKSCLNFKAVADLNLKTLQSVMGIAVKQALKTEMT